MPGTQQRAGQVLPFTQIMPLLAPFYGWLPKSLWDLEKDFFVYTAETNLLPVAANQSATADIAIQADSDFLIVAGVRNVSASDDQSNIASPLATITILDAGSGRQLMDRAVHIENLFGTAQLPCYWPYPKLIKRASTLSTTVNNLDTANNRNFRLSYLGFKIFGYAKR